MSYKCYCKINRIITLKIRHNKETEVAFESRQETGNQQMKM